MAGRDRGGFASVPVVPHRRDIGIALLGLGNVGAGVVKLLEDNAAAITERLGARLVVRAIAVRAPGKKNRLVEVDPALLTADVTGTIGRDDVDLVCELIGGEDEARAAVLGAIAAGKHVVTANKALLAAHGEEVFAAALARGVDVYYEAAVCGGVPVIRVLREGLASDRVEWFYGIVNGTSNFILTEMAQAGRGYPEVLAEAQARGYAEADPTLDVSGGDAAHKLAILAMLCFGTTVDAAAIPRDGIDTLDPIDFRYAEKFGYVIKPIVVGREHPGAVELRVHPAMVPAHWMLADVSGAKNALYVSSYALGPSLYYGAGAGMMPTAMAVVSDVIEIARNILAGVGGVRPLRRQRALAAKPMLDLAEVRTRYYLRFTVEDRPGVLGRLTTLLGEHQVSILQVVQDGAEGDAPVSVVVLTHEAREGDLRAALARIAEAAGVVAPTRVIRVQHA
jgi:homoserine dehydrogenase